MSHSLHPDLHEVGLVDDCERCTEHAQHPINSLDNESLGSLIQRIVDEEDSRSENERVAMLNVKRTLDEACALAKTNPKAFALYAKKWGIDFVAVL